MENRQKFLIFSASQSKYLILGIISLILTSFLTSLQAEIAQSESMTQLDSWVAAADNIISGRRRRGGSRGEVCPIAPGQVMNVEKVWNLNPALIWQGEAARIELYQLDSDTNPKPLWTWTATAQRATSDPVVIQYDGDPLIPGQVYEWQVFDTTDDSVMTQPPIQFKTVTPQLHQQIQTELNQLESPQDNSSEAMTLKRVNYLIRQQLWADALQEIYTVNNPSPALQQVGEKLTAHFCPLG